MHTMVITSRPVTISVRTFEVASLEPCSICYEGYNFTELMPWLQDKYDQKDF